MKQKRITIYLIVILWFSCCVACNNGLENRVDIFTNTESAPISSNEECVIFWNAQHRTEFEEIDLTFNDVFLLYEKTDNPKQLYAFSAEVHWVTDKNLPYDENCAMSTGIVADMAWELIIQDLGFVIYDNYPFENVFDGKHFLATLDQVNAIEKTARYRGYVLRIFPLLSPKLIEEARSVLIARGDEDSLDDSNTVWKTAFEICSGPKQEAVEIVFSNPD